MASKDFMIPFMRGFVNEDYVEIDRNLSLLDDSCPINKRIREIRNENNWENKISMVIGERINSLINTYECTDDIQSLFFDFAQTFVETAQFLSQEKYALALDKYVDCFKDFARLYKILSRNYRSDWLFQIFDRFYSNLRKIAIKADDQERKRGNNKEHLVVILDALSSNRQEMNRLKTGDTLDHKIKLLILIEVHADAINYRLSNFKTVKDGIYNVATLIQSNNFDLFSLTKSLHVRLCYNWGKIALLTGRIPVAVQRLEEALLLASKKHDAGNIRLMLRYLAIAKVLNGQKIKKKLMDTYNLSKYYQLIEKIANGDLQGYYWETHFRYLKWMKAGLTLLFDSFRFVIYRNILKKLHSVYKFPEIPFSIIKKSFELNKKAPWHPEYSEDEIQAILSNMIVHGYIKGSISINDQLVSLSRVNPFPKLVNVNNEIQKNVDKSLGQTL